MIVPLAFVSASSQMTCSCHAIFHIINIWAKECVGSWTEQKSWGIAAKLYFLTSVVASFHIAQNPLLVITNLSMHSWCNCGQRGLTLCSHDYSKMYGLTLSMWEGFEAWIFLKIKWLNLPVLFLPIIYFLLPVLHFHYMNNNYSNEPLGFGRV